MSARTAPDPVGVSGAGSQLRVIADGWYSWVSGLPAFTTWLGERSGLAVALASRSGALRGLLLFLASARHDVVAMIHHDPGWRTLLLLRGCLGRRRKLVVFHLIARDVRPGGAGRLIDRVWARLEPRLGARAVRAAQVLTEWERERYAEQLRLPLARIRYIPFPWRSVRTEQLPPAAAEPLVVSIGRALCDWPTLFEAARGADWPLVVACARDDLPAVTALNADGRATVLCDIEQREAEELLRRATLSVISMREARRSQGHARLRDAVDAGVPVVASDTMSLRDYALDGQTALLVPPGDPERLRAAIDRLMEDPDLRERLGRGACERSQRWVAGDYLEAIEAFVHGRPLRLPPSGAY